MANDVTIILKAVDKASAEINKVTTAGGKLSAGFKSLTGMSLGAGAAIAGIGAAAKWIKDAIDQTVQYATEIDNMSRLLGISTEDTSRLVQASDDLFISQEKLSSGLQAATRQGIDVSIDGLKRLSEQYLALPNGVERSTFVLKTFGRSGAEMAKLMEQGADGIDAATAAIAKNMVITDQSMVSIMNYKRSLDSLNDSWQGVKYTIGTEVISELDLFLRMMMNGKDELTKLELQLWRLENPFFGLLMLFGINKEKAEDLRAEIERLRGELDGTITVAESMDNAGEAMLKGVSQFSSMNKNYHETVTDLIKARGEELSGIKEAEAGYWSYQGAARAVWEDLRSVNNQLKNYRPALDASGESLKSLTEKQQKLKEELAGYEQVWGVDTNAVKDHKAALDEIDEKLREIAREQEIATNKIVLGYIEQELAVDGLSAAESEWLIQKGVDMGVYEQSAVSAYGAARTEAQKLLDIINGIPEEKNVYVHVFSNYGGEMGGIGGAEIASGVDLNGNGIIGKVGGGLGGGRTLVGEFGPEVVDLPPGSRVHNATNSAGMGSGNVNIDYDRMGRALVNALVTSGYIR